MRVRSPAALVSAVLVAAALAQAAAADQAAWLTSRDWTARRVVDVKPDAARAAGDVAVVAFYSGGLTKGDAGDVRVAVRGHQVVNHRVLQVGPGDLVRVVFELAPGETRYFLYYGNPKADAPPPWEPKRGVLMEARKDPGTPVDRLPPVQAAWAKAAPLGADMVSYIFFGFNPFADSETPAILHFTGWVVPPKSGNYAIDLSTNGGSWLLVDGQMLIEWPGPHPPSGHARRAKQIALTQAPHRLDLWNVNAAGPMTAAVLWQAPQTDRFEPIPAKAFLPVAQATLVETDLPGERMVADFFAENAGETWWPDQYAVRMRFRNLSKAVSAQYGGRFDWDFGDGQTSAAPSPTHVYLASGDYTVTLKASRLADAHTFRTKVHVARNWWRQLEPAVDPIRSYAEEAAKYDFAKLDMRNLVAAASLFEHENLHPALAAVAAEILKRPGLDGRNVQRYGLALGEHLRAAGQAAQAVAAYRQLEERLKKDAAAAEAASRAADTLLRDLGRWDEAEKECQRVLKTYATSGQDPALRRAQIGLGDIWRHRGDGEKARKSYAAAAAIKIAALTPNEAAVRVGTLARYVEEYTRERQWEWTFKFLDDWAWEFPGDKLQGHWSMLRASALATRGDREAALLEALDLVGANPGSAYAVRLLMLAAECHVAAGRTDKARLLLQTAVEDYPEDPQRDAARTRLGALGGPVGAEKPKRP